MATLHEPVLLQEVITYLDPQVGENFIDCTLGGGGHTLAILKKTEPAGKVLAIDADPVAIESFRKRSLASGIDQERVVLINDNFLNLKENYDRHFSYPVSGVLFDLGLSSDQLRDENRGFSFQTLGPLDMRFDPLKQEETALDIINSYSEQELYYIFKNFSQEPHARRVAQEIVRARRRLRITTTKQLVEVIRDVVSRRSRHHPATLVFQGLRIAVNHELDNLISALPAAYRLLKPGGRLAVISFHSLEDRLVKNFFRDQKKAGHLVILTKKPVVPNAAEVLGNPLSRSAKLRVAEKI